MVDAVIFGGGSAGVSVGTVLQRKGYKDLYNRNTDFSKGKTMCRCINCKIH